MPSTDDGGGPLTWIETSTAACSGAVVTSLLITPLDVAKVRMQASAGAMQVCECCEVSSSMSTSSVILRVARHEGVASLWAGLQPALVMNVPGTVMYFSAYERLRDQVAQRWPRLRDYAPLIAGGAARTVTAAVVSPIELMRTRMQVHAVSSRPTIMIRALPTQHRAAAMCLASPTTPSPCYSRRRQSSCFSRKAWWVGRLHSCARRASRRCTRDWLPLSGETCPSPASVRRFDSGLG